METDTMTIHGLAEEAGPFFETLQRGDGSKYVTLKDERPEWLYKLVFTAHVHGDMLPDDWRYECTRDALVAIAEAGEDADLDDVGTEFADAADVYTSDLLAWMASHGQRPGYCDSAREDGLVAEDADMARRMMVGQYVERAEVFGLVRQSLEALAEG